MTFPPDGPGPAPEPAAGTGPYPLPEPVLGSAADLAPAPAPVLGLGADPAPEPSAGWTWQPVPPVAPAWQTGGPRRDRLPPVRGVFAFILAIAIAFGAGAAFTAGGTGPGLGTATGPQTTASFPPQFAVYEQAWKILQDNYVDPKALDATVLTYGSISGLLSAVGDTDHTRFLSPRDLAAENSSLSGSVVGIGAEMSTVNSAPIIQAVIPGSPAEKAGLLGGDTVLSIDTVSTEGLSIDTVVSKIRGDAGTSVVLSILHSGSTTPVSISIVRAKVVVPTVSWAMIPGTTVADIRLDEFSNNATSELVAAIAAVRTAGATALVLDLRGNPGGYVDQAIGVASQFLKDGDVYQEQDRTGTIRKIPVKSGGTAADLPLAVLVDNGTASSAEIVAGALQDAKRGTLIGAKTFGTGTVLRQFPLSDGSALLVGTIEWLTRDGRQIWKQGIAPDIALDSTPKGKIVVPAELGKMTVAQLTASGDAQLIKAVSVLTGKS